MDEILAELTKLAREFPIAIILPKAPPLTASQEQRMKDHINDPYRFVDYIGLIKP